MNKRGVLVGLVGCGKWGINILRDLVSLGCRVAVVEPCSQNGVLATRGGAVCVVEGIDDLPPCTGIIVASPASTHATVIESLLPRRIPIFCEKPLTIDAAVARRLAEQAPDRLFVMDKWRYHPGILELAKIARSGELGLAAGLKTSRVGPGLWQTDVDCAWTLLPHELTIGLEILGHIPRPRMAVAERAADGALVGLNSLLEDEVWHRTEIGSHGRAVSRCVELVCAEGLAILPDAYSDYVLLVRPACSRADAVSQCDCRPISTELPLMAELRAFLSHLQGGPAPRSSAAEATSVVETIAEIRRLAGLASCEGQKRGQAPFVRSTLWAVPANGA